MQSTNAVASVEGWVSCMEMRSCHGHRWLPTWAAGRANRLYAVQDQCCLWNGYCTIHPQPPITRPWHCMLPFALRKVTRGIIDNYIFLKQQFSHKLVHALIHVLTCNTSKFALMMWIRTSNYIPKKISQRPIPVCVSGVNTEPQQTARIVCYSTFCE